MSDSLPHAVPLYPVAHDVGVEAAGVHLSVLQFTYSHQLRKQAQRGDSLCEMTLQACLVILET